MEFRGLGPLEVVSNDRVSPELDLHVQLVDLHARLVVDA
jgi:hypothetical protein